MIPQYEPLLDQTELAYISKCIEANWITAGKMVKEFEQKIADMCGVKYSLATCNGTMALFVLLKACGIGKGDEVIVPDFTHVASANAVLLCGAKPVFCDVDDTLCIDVRKAFVSGKTKAIMPVGIYGQSPDMDAIENFAEKHGLMVIQDAAQDLGITWRGHTLCSYGMGSILSFYGDKLISTAEGGMVLTDDEELITECKVLCHHGSTKMGSYYHEAIGWNFRLSDVHAAIGLAQLTKFDKIVEAKLSIHAQYQTTLSDNSNVKFAGLHKHSNFIPFRVVIFIDNPVDLQKHLADNRIETRRVFYPLHLQPCYKGIVHIGGFRNSIWAYEHGLALPSSAKLSCDDVEYVCDKVKEFYK